MSAYFLVLLAIASRVVPHPEWLNFTALGGALLYFGARRPFREMVMPVALLAGTDYYLTTVAYGYPFHLESYLVTWLWYAGAMAIGAGLLKERVSAGRVLGGAALSATSFFLLSNFAVWMEGGIYPHTGGGLAACYIAALPFFRNDIISTSLVAGLAFCRPLFEQFRSFRRFTIAGQPMNFR